MSRTATKAADNVFYKARIEASSCNEGLSSREGAAYQTGIDRTRLARIELGSLNPYPEEVLLMSDIYNAPEIKAYYCKECCTLGCDNPKIEIEDLDRISLKALSSIKKMTGIKDALLSIVEDGLISDDEKPELNNILSYMNEMDAVFHTFRLWVEKNIKDEQKL